MRVLVSGVRGSKILANVCLKGHLYVLFLNYGETLNEERYMGASVSDTKPYEKDH